MKKSEMPEVGWVVESEIQEKIRNPTQKPEFRSKIPQLWELDRKIENNREKPSKTRKFNLKLEILLTNRKFTQKSEIHPKKQLAGARAKPMKNLLQKQLNEA